MDDSTGQVDDIGGNLCMLIRAKSKESKHVTDQLYFVCEFVQAVTLTLYDTVFVSYEAQQDCKLNVGQLLSLLGED